MKKAIWLILLYISFIFTGCGDHLSRDNGQDNWITLFDGSNVSAWRGLNSDSLPGNWVVQEGLLVIDPAANSGGDIITKEQFSDFVLELEFKLSKGANSGIKYFVVEELSKGKRGLGLEYQIIDDQSHPDAQNGIERNHTTASLYDLIAADQQKCFKPAGQWSKVKIVSRGRHIEHWLNAKKVLEYQRGSRKFMDRVAQSKFKDIQGFGLAEKGHILLQDHGDRVWYRNIKIKNLN